MQVAGKSRAADGNGDLQLSILGINSLNTPLTKNIGVISKPTRRKSRNISTNGADEIVGSVNGLAINGSSSRRYNFYSLVSQRCFIFFGIFHWNFILQIQNLRLFIFLMKIDKNCTREFFCHLNCLFSTSFYLV